MEIGPISHCPHLPLPRRTRACPAASRAPAHCQRRRLERALYNRAARRKGWRDHRRPARPARSEEHTSELQSLMRNSYAVFCLKKKITTIEIMKKKTYTTTSYCQIIIPSYS